MLHRCHDISDPTMWQVVSSDAAPRGHDHHLHHRLLFCLLARHQGVCHLPSSTQFYPVTAKDQIDDLHIWWLYMMQQMAEMDDRQSYSDLFALDFSLFTIASIA